MKIKVYIAGLLLFLSPLSSAQTDRKAAELKNLEKNLVAARARVVLNEKQLAAADSLINLGQQMIKEGKSEVKTVYAESDDIEKEYASKHKPLEKLSASKNKAEVTKARADLKALDAKYRADNLSLEIRLKSAERKQTSGASYISRGKTARLNARDALKTSGSALKAAQGKYDAAAAPAEINKTKQEK
jgi:hypothetical protein